MRVPRSERIILAEVVGFAAITLAAASVVLQMTDTRVAMCGATGAPTMGPRLRRRFELGWSQERTCGHADRSDQIQRETPQHSGDHHRRKASNILKSLSGSFADF